MRKRNTRSFNSYVKNYEQEQANKFKEEPEQRVLNFGNAEADQELDLKNKPEENILLDLDNLEPVESKPDVYDP